VSKVGPFSLIIHLDGTDDADDGGSAAMLCR
jgi:hypothetical protein